MLDIPVTAWGIPEKNYTNDMSLEIIQPRKKIQTEMLLVNHLCNNGRGEI